MQEVEIKQEFMNVEDESFKITTIEAKKYQFGISYQFDIGIAEKYGINEAIMLNNLIFWIRQNKANNKNFYDGYYWTFNSIRAFSELFPFWTNRQIGYILDSLEKQNIIKKGNYNKIGYDRTLWYTIIDKSILQICQIELTEMQNRINENVEPIPDINTDNKTQIIKQDIELIYNSYPNRCLLNNNRNTKKNKTCKIKIERLLKKGILPAELIELINLYIDDCARSKTYISNFETFLNNLPDKNSFENVNKVDTPVKKTVGYFTLDDGTKIPKYED